MKIINLKSQNVKGIKAVDITPRDNVVVISGKNGQGKTSVLDSIAYAICGKKGIPSEPIRKGETHAEIEIDLGHFIVKRTFTDKGSYLEVISKDKAKYTNPQTFLDEIMGSLSFDPLEFSRLSSKEQRDQLLKLAGVSFDDLEDYKAKLYEERTLIGREGQKIKGYFNSLVKPEGEISKSEVEPGILMDRLRLLQIKNQGIEDVQRNIAHTEEEIEELELQLQANRELLKARKAELKKLGKKVDTTQIEEQIKNASTVNSKIVQMNEWKKAKAELDLKVKEYNDFTETIKKVDADKAGRLSKAKMPIDGLSANDEEVTYREIPFNQLSGAEQLKVSMAIAMSANPKLKVILIRDGSLLDEDNMKVIREMATGQDFQVWLEVVDDAGHVGFRIEEGEIVK